jgi:hypothetical protein
MICGHGTSLLSIKPSHETLIAHGCWPAWPPLPKQPKWETAMFVVLDKLHIKLELLPDIAESSTSLPYLAVVKRQCNVGQAEGSAWCGVTPSAALFVTCGRGKLLCNYGTTILGYYEYRKSAVDTQDQIVDDTPVQGRKTLQLACLALFRAVLRTLLC